MQFLSFSAATDDDGRRLDRVVRRYLAEQPLGGIYAHIRKGLIRVNEKKADAAYRLHAGDVVAIADFLVPAAPAAPAPKEMHRIQLSDIFCNDAVRIINKPYGVSVQGGGGMTVADAIKADYAEKHGLRQSLSFTPAPLHRLDRQTTGILVCSQNLRGAQWFSHALALHRIQKEYIALVQGRLPAACVWQDAVCPYGGQPQKRFHRVTIPAAAEKQNSAFTAKGKHALTAIAPAAYGTFQGRTVTLAHIVIATGRKHQIRAHSSAHGFPLAGDTAYGAAPVSGSQSLFLHAWRITVPEHNEIGIPAHVQAPPPKPFMRILQNSLPEIANNSILQAILDTAL
ncbi:MAG TPA: RluA family pseudouridine synthase [Candidatus Treponema faecavium]|nr:RluA family pseudouridine synthase [Candidatus Treponema faecavium]